MIRRLLLGVLTFPLALDLGAQVAVRVLVRTAIGEPVPDAYVAFVAPDRPAWRPSAEVIAPRGVATVRVVPGSYKVFAGGRGLQDSVRSVQVQAPAEIVFDLAAGVPVGGVVQDEQGRPLAGAAVRHLRAVGPTQRAQVSDLARHHFAQEWSTRTDAQGRWSLPGRSDGAIPVLIEADGFAPEQVFCRAEETVATTLRKGSRLHVRFDRVEPELFVTLLRDAADPARSGWETIAWAQPVETAAIAWDSLPPGEYHLIARYYDPRRFMQPVPVATAVLADEQTAEVDVTLPKPVTPAPDAAVLFVPGKNLDDLVALRVLVSTPDALEEVRHSLEAVSGGTLVYAATAATPALLMTEQSIFIPRSSAVRPGEPMATLASGRADISVLVARQETGPPLPRSGVARIGACAFRESLSMAASITPDGRIDLPFPAECRSLALSVPPFEPVLIQMSLAPGTRKSFGPYVLAIGGSASIHVVRDPGGSSAPRATVQVLLTEASRGERTLVAEGTADEGGKLVLAGLPADRELVFEAHAADRGISGSVRARIDAGRTATIDPLPIPEPANVVVIPRLSAEVRRRFATARIHAVTIERDSGDGLRDRKSADLRNAGEASFEDLHPGMWRALVLVEAAGSMQPVPLPDIVLRAGETRRFPADVELDVFDGVVMNGAKTLAAQVGFGEPPAPESVRRFARTDAQGRFTIILPRPGMYNVTVTPLDHPETIIDAGDVRFDDPARPVTIHVPAASLLVHVSDRGEPLWNAAVTAVLRRTSALGNVAEVVRRANTGNNGEVQLDSLLDGRWLIQATVAGKRGEAAAEVRAGEQSLVELEVKPLSSLQGFVHEPTGAGVAEARVDCLLVGPSGMPQSLRAETDAAGRFAVELPTPPPQRLHCGVTTGTGRVAAYALAPTSNADLVLPSETASLAIPDWGARFNRDLYWLVAPDGRLFNLSWQTGKSGGLWSPLSIQMESGSWKIVRVNTFEDWLRLATAGGNALTPVVEFRLDPAEAKTIHLHGTERKEVSP